MTFGSIVASGLPIATALFGLGISTALIGTLAAVVDTPDWAESVAAMIGIGVGIDYALLILTRFRAALGRGLDARAATVEAVAIAGRGVVIAGQHRRDLAARTVRGRPPLSLWRRAGGDHRGARGHGRVADAAAGAARVRRASA